MSLRLFLDCADPEVWARLLPTGLFHGVTTNPTLLLRANQPCQLPQLRELTLRALDLGCREIHLQAWGPDHPSLAACGHALAGLATSHDHAEVVVKLPLTLAGGAAARELIAAAIPVTFTACYEAAQVTIAAALGARYIAPYLGRICDQGRDGHAELITMQQMLPSLQPQLRLLVASLRQPSDISRLAAAGLDTFTINASLVETLFANGATAAAAAQFERDAAGNRS